MQNDVNEPDELARDLEAIYGVQLKVPAEVNRVVLNQARVHWAMLRRRRILRIAAAATTVAAMVAIAMRVGSNLSNPAVPKPQAVAIVGDFNGDGLVDVRDALGLAKQIAADHPDQRWDINHDGRIDQRDVDQIALSAVKLPVAGELQ